MKKSLKKAVGIVLLLSTITLISTDILDNIKLSDEQAAELKKLTNLYKFQISRFFDFCKTGKNPKFKRVQPGEYEYLFAKSKKELEETIQKITTLYAKFGITQNKIKEEEKVLHDGIQNCIP